ncbi:hypothetical protein EKO25_20845 [Bacillus sp. SAJ1]|nr:hypothetical protein EKO25_20845 [Bacillus sp. SAJ1]
MLTFIENRTIAGIFMMIIFSLVSTFLLSDIFLEDENLNLKYIWYFKYGVIKYHLFNVVSILIIVFLISFLCFGFNILLSYLSFGSLNVSSNSLFFDNRLETFAHDITHYELLLKSPVLFFLLKNTYISMYASLFAILGYLLSIFIKNKYIIILLPTIIYNAIGLVTSVVGRPGYSLYYLLYPDFSVTIRKPELINIYGIVLLCVNIALFFTAIKREKEYV